MSDLIKKAREKLEVVRDEDRLALRNALLKANEKLKSIKDAFYGQNMELTGFHLNGNTEPIDSFFESNDWEPVEITERTLSGGGGMNTKCHCIEYYGSHHPECPTQPEAAPSDADKAREEFVESKFAVKSLVEMDKYLALQVACAAGWDAAMEFMKKKGG